VREAERAADGARLASGSASGEAPVQDQPQRADPDPV
jgi:hypothetical protein